MIRWLGLFIFSRESNYNIFLTLLKTIITSLTIVSSRRQYLFVIQFIYSVDTTLSPGVRHVLTLGTLLLEPYTRSVDGSTDWALFKDWSPVTQRNVRLAQSSRVDSSVSSVVLVYFADLRCPVLTSPPSTSLSPEVFKPHPENDYQHDTYQSHSNSSTKSHVVTFL